MRGIGASPATPSVKVCAESFEAKERYGAIWIRRAGSNAAFPDLGRAGFVPMANMIHRVHRSMELVLDNFVEVEHTATTHWLLGYERSAMADVKTEVDVTETSVRVYNRGPQKKVPKILMRLFDIHEGDHFVELACDFGSTHSKYRPVEVNIFTTSQLWVKTGADFEETGDATPDFGSSCRRSRDAAKNF